MVKRATAGPLGLSIADILAGQALTAGILAALVRRGIAGEGAHVQTSLLKALVDLQFELLTTHLNDGQRPPTRAGFRNANAYLAAPYGIYATSDGYLALAMMPLEQLARVLPLPALDGYDERDAFARRDEIKRLIAAELRCPSFVRLADSRKLQAYITIWSKGK